MLVAALLIAYGGYQVLYLLAYVVGAKLLRLPAPEEVVLWTGPRLARFTRGGTAYELRLIPLGASARWGEGVLTGDSAPQKGAAVLLMLCGPVSNLIVGLVLAQAALWSGLDVLRGPGALIVAAEGDGGDGLRPGDRVLVADGRHVRWGKDLALCLSRWESGNLTVELERDGRAMSVELRRDEGRPRDGRIVCRSDAEGRAFAPLDALTHTGGLVRLPLEQVVGNLFYAPRSRPWWGLPAPRPGQALTTAEGRPAHAALSLVGVMGVAIGLVNLVPVPPFVGY